jgi:hypothetical protein
MANPTFDAQESQDPPAGGHIPLQLRHIRYYKKESHHYRGQRKIPLGYKLTRVWLAGYRGEFSLGRQRDWHHWVVRVVEVCCRLRLLAVAYGTEILKLDKAWECWVVG